MDPQIRRQRTFEAIKRLLLRESLNQPLLLIFEDLHWLDAESQAFLLSFSDSVATARVLLLVNYRPEYQHPWGSKTYYSQLRLDPLGKVEAEEMLTVLLEEQISSRPSRERDGVRVSEPDLQPLKRFILEKTEGNPFFMEEIVQTLHEQGIFGVGAPLQGLQLPATVQGVLAARIDRLPAEEKALLQTLSVIGKEFSLGLLKKVADLPEDELHRHLSHLREAEFIYEQPAFPDPEYVFKHALTQEVAYSSLLVERRKVLHEQTARAIEVLFHERLEDHYSELAYHYSRSGNTHKAVEHLHLAGQQAARRSAYAEAIQHYSAALELLQTLRETPERTQPELTLQLALAASLQATKGPSAPEVERAYTRARELCQHGGEAQQLFSALRGLWVLRHVRGDLSTARELGEQLLSMAEQRQDPALLLEAHRALGSTLLWRGEFARARLHLEQARSFYDPRLHHALTFLYGGADPGVTCFCETARALWFLGYPDQALEQSQSAVTLARNLSDPFSLGFAVVFAAGIHQFRREGHAAQRRAEEGIALATEQEFVALAAAGTIRRGWALAEQGQVEEGLKQMQQGLAARQTMRAALAQPYFLALQAEVYGKLGEDDRALVLLEDALAVVNISKEYRLEAELYRLKGELTLQKGARGWGLETGKTESQKSKGKSQRTKIANTQPPAPSTQAEAETCFLKAIEIAKRQQAKSLELRATMSLVRLRQQQAMQDGSRTTQHETRIRLDGARNVLSEIYNWFTEGFDTKDLQEAKALLEELQRESTFSKESASKETL